MKNVYLILLTAALVLCQPTSSSAQNNVSGNQIYTEIGGPGFMSLNFDGRFKGHSRLGMGYKLGVGTVRGAFWSDNDYARQEKMVATFPISLSCVFGKPDSNHAFEVSAGCTIFTEKIYILFFSLFDDCRKDTNVLGNASFMYRRVPINGGFTWRIGCTTFFTDSQMVISPTLGLGFAF